MIKEFNQSQLTYGILRLLLSLFLFGSTYLFFLLIGSYFVSKFEIDSAKSTVQLIAVAGTLIIAVSGFLRWRNGQGHYSVTEALISDQLDTSTGGAWGMQNYTNRATGCSYLLTSLFIAAPIQALKAWGHFQARIPYSFQLEQKLTDLLQELRHINKWQDLLAYSGKEEEFTYLIRMKKVEFSAQKGRVKACSES